MINHEDEDMNPGGVNGIGNEKVDVTSEDFAVLRKKIVEKAKSQTKRQILENRVLTVKLSMVDYLDNANNIEAIDAGAFLKTLLDDLGI